MSKTVFDVELSNPAPLVFDGANSFSIVLICNSNLVVDVSLNWVLLTGQNEAFVIAGIYYIDCGRN